MPEFITFSRIKSALILIGTLISIYAVLGFSILPAVLSNKIPSIVKEQLKRDVSVKDIQFNPFSLEFSIHGLQLDELDNSVFVKFERLYVNLAVLDSLFDLSLKIDQILLESPYVSIKRDNKSDFNFTDLIPAEDSKEDKKDESEGGIFPVTIALISISEGKVSWTDNLNSAGHQEDIYPLNLNIDNFTTHLNKQSDLGFSLKFASGGQFDWRGDLTLNPLKSTGHIELNHINFPRVWELFLKDSVNFAVLKGTELIRADYQFSNTKESTQLLINNADLSLLDIQIAEQGHKNAVIAISDFKVLGVSLDLLNQDIKIEKISSNDARIIAWLNTDSSINFQSLFVPKNSAPPKSPPANTKETTASKPWNILLKQLDINNYALNFTDKTLSPANTINLSSIKLSSSNLSAQQGASLPFNLTFNFNKSGSLGVDGHAILEPLSSELRLNVANIALKDFQPYVNQFARLDIISGLFNLNANISLQQKKDHPLAVVFKGNSHIDKLATRDQISNKDFVNWKKLSVDNIEVDLAANRYIIDSITIDQPYARILIRKDKSININDIVIEKPEDKVITEKKPTVEKTPVPSPNFKINHFVMTGGKSDFSDKSLILPFSAHITHLKGSVKGISSDKNANIKIALNGKVADFSPVKIKGNISPSKGNSNFKVSFNSMPLPLMTPYMAEFAGRKIEKGNMTLKFQYKIRNKKLDASNSLLIDQLVLGDEVDNPDAVSLPLGLAIALLQDGDGKIKLDVPITGDLDNPEFSVTGIIVDALVNVLTKIVTSPFNAIASLIGSDEDISSISFAAGKTNLDPKQQEKLDNLAIALLDRPALKLEIQGAAYSVQDWPQMQMTALNKQILQLRIDELIKEKSKKALPKELSPSNEEYQRLLANLFIEKFPTLADKSLFGKPRLINSKSDDFYGVAQKKLSALIKPDHHLLHDLAVARAKAIASYLIEKKIEVSRVFLLDVKIANEVEEQLIASQLNLTVD